MPSMYQKLIERRNNLRGLITMHRNLGNNVSLLLEELVSVEAQLQDEFDVEACVAIYLTGREITVLLAHLNASGVADNALIAKLGGN